MAVPADYPLTIPVDSTDSVVSQDLGELTPVGVYIPAEFNGVAISFKRCATAGGTFKPVYKDDGNLYTVTVAADRYVALDYTKLAGCRFLQVIAASTQTTTPSVLVLALRQLS